MAHYHPHDCLAYQLGRPLLRQQSIEGAACSKVAQLMLGFHGQHSETPKPESEALGFYQLSHAMALIQQRRHPHEPLPAAELALADEYFTVGSVMAQRAFNYLVMICQREARHLHNKDHFNETITSQWGAQAYSYICTLPDSATQAMHKFTSNPPKCAIGPYVKALQHIFYAGSWSGGYGGKAWGQVTDCLVDFVTGKYSPAMMVDTVWTLCHNNGPIFNKGHWYSMYNGNCLVQILDVQRAGLIPSFIENPVTPLANLAGFVTPEIKERNGRIRALFPEVPETVDWAKVQELGAVLSYTGGGYAKHHKAKLKTKPTVPLFEVHPGLLIPKIKMKRAA